MAFGPVALIVTTLVVSYAKPPASVPLCEFGFVTVTSTTPAPAGVVQVICTELMKVTPVAGFPPKVTVAPATKSVPATLTAVPPASGPVFRVTTATVGVVSMIVTEALSGEPIV